jgi:hypothetical protein
MTAAGSARATSEVGRVVQDTRPYVVRTGIEQELSSFDLPAAAGTRYTFAGRVDWPATERMALRVRAPVHHLWLADGGERMGPGDAELRLKLRLLQVADYVKVQAGVIETLPTGSAVRGLGNGAMVITPFVTGGRRFGRVIVYAYGSDAVTLRNTKATQYEDFTDPSSNHELRNAVGATGGPFDALQGNVSLNATTILTGRATGETFVFAGAIVAFTPTDRLRVQLGGQHPVAGDRRFEWKATLDVYASF